MNKCVLCGNPRTTLKLGALPYKKGFVCPKCQREKLYARPYLLRDVPADIQILALKKAASEDRPLRVVILELMRKYGEGE
jgi:recombinational DNA repair protein (RecF pathway)